MGGNAFQFKEVLDEIQKQLWEQKYTEKQLTGLCCSAFIINVWERRAFTPVPVLLGFSRPK